MDQFSGDGSYCAISDDGATRYVSAQLGIIAKQGYSNANDTSPNTTIRINPNGASGYLFIAPFELDTNNDEIMYLAAGATLWRNNDLSTATQSNGWQQLTNAASSSGSISAIGISTVPANVVYFGTTTGQIRRINNANSGNPASTLIETGLPNGNVSSIAVDPTNSNNVIATFSNYGIQSVFSSTNAGDSWTNVSGNIEANVNGSGDGPSVSWVNIVGESALYLIGTSTGMYSTAVLNGNATVWTEEAPNAVGNVPVDQIKSNEEGKVVVATHGRGLWSATYDVNEVTTLAEIDVLGNGISIVDGDATPEIADNTLYPVDTGNITRTFTIENTGTETLILENTAPNFVLIAGDPEFTISSQPPTGNIAAGSSVTFDVTYTPGSVFKTTTAITIVSSDDNENPYNFTIETNAAVEPCTPAGNCAQFNDGVRELQLADQDLIVNCDVSGYSDDTAIAFEFDLTQNNLYNGVVQLGFVDSSFAIWIDFDDSGTFDSSELIVTDDVAIANTDFNFSVDFNALAGVTEGIHRMRVRGEDTDQAGELLSPCDDLTFGSTNDYLANIIIPECLDTTIFNAGNWDNGLPNTTTAAIIASNYNTTAGSIEACSLTVNNNVLLIISENTFVNVQNDVVNNGSIDIAHQGSLVQVADDGVATNNGEIEVAVTSAILQARDFMVLGSPLTNAVPIGVDNPIFRKLQLSTAAFRPNPDVQLLYPGGANFVDEDNNDFSAQSGSFASAKGYLVWPQPSLTVGGVAYPMTFTQDATQVGTLNTGTINYAVTFNTTGNGTGTSEMNKNASPNTISNPYPSAISTQDFIAGNIAVDEVYFWEHNTTPGDFPGANNANFNMADISVYNAMGFNPSSTGSPITMTIDDVMISTAQGFGIKNNGMDTNVQFTNSMRRTTGNTTLRTPENVDRLWLEISNSEFGLSSSMLVGFTDNATAMFDAKYDSPRLGSPVSIYSHLIDGSASLAIQGRETFNANIEVGVGFSTLIEKNNAVYSISLAGIQGSVLENGSVYLKDHLNGEVYNISETSYTFNSSKGTFNNRFTIQFFNDGVLGSTEEIFQSVTVYPNPTNDILYISNPEKLNLEEAILYDLSGRELISIGLNANNKSLLMDVSSLSTATYILTIKGEDGVFSTQIIKD